MKTTAVIAEFNPFHNGHAALLRLAREETKATHLIAVMSGDFVQRGDVAVIEKYTRTRMALAAGADLVLELPHYYSLGSAEYFALGAVALLNRLGVTDHIAFGSECGDIDKLTRLAHILADEPPAFQLRLQKYLKEGDDFPTAREKALDMCLPEEEKELLALLKTPNNLLGIEYLKQMKRTKSRFTPVTMKRMAGVSAADIRASLLSPYTRIRKSQMPEACAMLLKDYPLRSGYVYGDVRVIFPALIHRLSLSDAALLSQYADVGEALANRILQVQGTVFDLQMLADALHTKDMTRARIRRALLHIFLEMPQKTYDTLAKKHTVYARVLGFRKSASPLMNRIKTAGKIPLITKTAQARKLLEGDRAALQLFEEDLRASAVYDRLFTLPDAYPLKTEYEKPVVVI